jgi:hypothetical protein
MGADKNSSFWLNSAYTPIATPRTHMHKQDPKQAQTTSKEPPRSLGTRSGSKQTRTEAQALNCKSLGGLSVWDRRTVREGVADRPATTRGLSEKHSKPTEPHPEKSDCP